MINLIPMLIKYRHFIGYGAAVLALIASVWYIHHKGYEACQREAMAQELTITEKRNEVANNIGDDMQLINGLRTHDKTWK